jgi:hypothetical protein
MVRKPSALLVMAWDRTLFIESFNDHKSIPEQVVQKASPLIVCGLRKVYPFRSGLPFRKSFKTFKKALNLMQFSVKGWACIRPENQRVNSDSMLKTRPAGNAFSYCKSFLSCSRVFSRKFSCVLFEIRLIFQATHITTLSTGGKPPKTGFGSVMKASLPAWVLVTTPATHSSC